MSGFVYILGNEAMPGLFKIGCTRMAPHDRAEQLSVRTCVPLPFDLIASVAVASPFRLERELHQRHASGRVAPDREFFRLTGCELAALVETLRGRGAFTLHAAHRKYGAG